MTDFNNTCDYFLEGLKGNENKINQIKMSKEYSLHVTFFHKHCPYFLEVNKKNNQYITGNREYKYIGYHTGSISDIVSDHKEWERHYLYMGDSQPWQSYSNMEQYVQNLESITKGLQLFQK